MIHTRMKQLRDKLGLTMPEFGKKLGVSRDVIANLEYERVEPKEVFLDHVCEVYQVNPGWLYGGNGPMFTPDADDKATRVATEMFRSLTPELKDLALSHMSGLQKLMDKQRAPVVGDMKDDLDTIRFTAALLNAEHFSDVLQTPVKQVKSGDYIKSFMDDVQQTKEQLVASSGLDGKVLDKILSSARKPTRDEVIVISLGLGLDADEAQRILAAIGLPALYAKNRRDSACMFALMKGLGVEQVNTLLAELEEPYLLQ